MKAGVITFPGSNCDDDCVFTLERLAEFEVARLWHKETPDLSGFDLMVVPGGFSYGDYLRCGAMASLSPIMEPLKAFAEKGGLVLGICNGFQILCEAGLLPGALTTNKSVSFICRDVRLKVDNPNSPWTNEMKAGQEITIPIAHGDGRYIVSKEEYDVLKDRGQVLLTYEGENPNGSEFSIAGMCNEKKNVFGLMPHPERATDLRSQDGRLFWASIRKHLQEAR